MRHGHDAGSRSISTVSRREETSSPPMPPDEAKWPIESARTSSKEGNVPCLFFGKAMIFQWQVVSRQAPCRSKACSISASRACASYRSSDNHNGQTPSNSCFFVHLAGCPEGVFSWDGRKIMQLPPYGAIDKHVGDRALGAPFLKCIVAACISELP